MKPSRQAKYRQVEEFVRQLDSALTDALDKGLLRRPTAGEPLRVVDLGCGNAYLTFAAHRFLTEVRGLPVALTGVDAKTQSRDHNDALAHELGIPATFVVGTIAATRLDPAPEVVLALHACDTATDDALARAVEWESPLVLAAPCCHHDIAAQLRDGPRAAAVLPADARRHPARAVRRHPHRRAARRSCCGWPATGSTSWSSSTAGTPRATPCCAPSAPVGPRTTGAQREYDDLVGAWRIRPRLAALLDARGA